MVKVCVQSTVLFVLLQVLITDGALKYLWGLINSAQLMALIQLIKFPIPSNNVALFKFLNLANGDF